MRKRGVKEEQETFRNQLGSRVAKEHECSSPVSLARLSSRAATEAARSAFSFTRSAAEAAERLDGDADAHLVPVLEAVGHRLGRGVDVDGDPLHAVLPDRLDVFVDIRRDDLAVTYSKC